MSVSSCTACIHVQCMYVRMYVCMYVEMTTMSSTVTDSSEIELRIRRLKEDLKQRKDEIKQVRQEQKRKKRALLQEREDQLKRKLMVSVNVQ